MTTRALIPLVAPCITEHDRLTMRAVAWGELLDDESAVQQFERRFAERTGCVDAVAVCSGTVALTLALDALDVGDVTIPTFTCEAVRDACGRRHIGYADSAFDVLDQRLEMEAPLTVLAHCFGQPAEIAPWVAKVEDWTLSFGGVSRLRSRLGVCSTHWSKMISTGRGGVVFGDDLELLVEVRKAGERYRMSSTQAALGWAQLEQLDSFIERRRRIARYYHGYFMDAGFEIPDLDCGSVFFRYLVAVDDPFGAVAELVNRGIECGHGVNPLLHRLAGLPDDDFSGACRDAARLLSVPVHPCLSDAEVEYVADQVVAVCGR